MSFFLLFFRLFKINKYFIDKYMEDNHDKIGPKRGVIDEFYIFLLLYLFILYILTNVIWILLTIYTTA